MTRGRVKDNISSNRISWCIFEKSWWLQKSYYVFFLFINTSTHESNKMRHNCLCSSLAMTAWQSKNSIHCKQFASIITPFGTASYVRAVMNNMLSVSMSPQHTFMKQLICDTHIIKQQHYLLLKSYKSFTSLFGRLENQSIVFMTVLKGLNNRFQYITLL